MELKRKVAILPTKEGGINMPDIPDVWNSLKVSWARRIHYSNAAWKKILENTLLGINSCLSSIWYCGTEEMIRIVKAIKNVFWKEVFFSFSKIIKSYAFAKPEKIMFHNIFDNFLFIWQGSPLKHFNFPMFAQKIFFK